MKKKIALVAGGYSGEHVISMKSADTIYKHLDKAVFDVYLIEINRQGWFYIDEAHEKISVVDKNDFTIQVNGELIRFDAAFIAIHGTPGEDGRLQGYFDMIGLPYTTCNAIVSALTFNKSYCNKVVKDMNMVKIANSVHLIKSEPYSVGTILGMLKLPLFVKPNEGGSSLGVSKVKTIEELLPAIERAFEEDNQVLIEEFIKGREFTIGVFKIGQHVQTLPPTEIRSKNEFFDFEAKYTTGVTEEITPADMPDEILEQLNHKAVYVYRHLNCRGIVRMDFILDETSDQLYFLEVNTMPGQSENSLIPQQVQAAKMDLGEFYKQLLLDCIPVGNSAS